MTRDDPLIALDVAERIVDVIQTIRDGYREIDWYHACRENAEMAKWFDWDRGNDEDAEEAPSESGWMVRIESLATCKQSTLDQNWLNKT